MVDIPNRTCRDCGLYAEGMASLHELFAKHSQSKFGFDTLCLECNRKRVGVRRRRHYRRNKEKILAKSSLYYQANKERINAKDREKYANLDKNSPEYAELMRRSSEYAKNNPEKARKAQQRWRKKNQAKLKEYKHRRRARESNAAGAFTAADIIRKVEEQNGCCRYCGVEEWDALTVDHMTPLSRGGSNFPSNIAMACLSCNTSKGAMTVDEFMAYRERHTGT